MRERDPDPQTLKNKSCDRSAGACLLQIVYSHRVKQFQEDSGGDPSALLIPALLDTKVRQSLLTSPAASLASAGCKAGQNQLWQPIGFSNERNSCDTLQRPAWTHADAEHDGWQQCA